MENDLFLIFSSNFKIFCKIIAMCNQKNLYSMNNPVPVVLPQLSVIIVISHVPQLCFKQLPATSSMQHHLIPLCILLFVIVIKNLGKMNIRIN